MNIEQFANPPSMSPSKKYPEKLPREAFEVVRPLLEGCRKQTKPRKIDLYEVFNAILYLKHTGCSWRTLPVHFPPWRSVHEYYLIWSRTPAKSGKSVLEEAFEKTLVL